MRRISGHFARRDRRNAVRPAVRRSGAFQRPGTVMVFVLGILTLLALVGIGLIASTRMDANRVDNQSEITSTSDSIQAIVKQFQETLRQDIWGAPGSIRPLDNSYPVGSGVNPLGLIENNEPIDAFHVDRWLSPLMPYPADVPTMALGAIPRTPVAGSNLFTGNLNLPAITIGTNPPAGEIDVLVWPSVSYLGVDLLIPRGGTGGQVNEFAWLYNTRNNVPGQLVRYGPPTPPALNTVPVAPDLVNVPVIQTWPPQPTARWLYDANGNPLPMIPGSTTNSTIRNARENWTNTQETAINAQMQLTNPAFRARFPYFDTNGDGIVDLYDADGDGVPDSPISFVLDGSATNPQSPSKLYAIIRVVDHGAMVNANVASSFAFSQNPPTALMFDEQNANLQRRGRRATELLLDDVSHTRDIFSLGLSNRAWQLVNYRTRFSTAVNDPLAYDQSVVRRDLIGGLTGNFGYRLFGLSDEASLRHRFSLVPPAYSAYSKAPPTNGVGYDKIDTALPWSLLWSNTLTDYTVPGSYPTRSYEQSASRWSRNNADFQPYGSATTYDGWDFNNTYNIGWRRMYTEDEPFSNRRPMFTTVSRDVMLPPADLSLNLSTGEIRQMPSPGVPVTWIDANGTPQTLTMNDPTDPWPMAQGTVPDWMRLLPIDINMTGNGAAGASALQGRFMKYMASAMFIALGGVDASAGITHTGGLVIPSPSDPKRFEYAWQFAANMGDYRDSDSKPSIIQLPAPINTTVFGLEQQPFFTEAFSRVEYNTEDGTNDPSNANDDDWFDAVELFIPPTWRVNANNLYLRAPGSSIPSMNSLGIPLSSFLNGASMPPVLDGNGLSLSPNTINTSGAYFVFCGSIAEAPTPFPDGVTTAGSFYSNAGFKLDHDEGSNTAGKVELVYSDPANPASTHVIDTIEIKNKNNIGLTMSPPRWAERASLPADGSSERFSLARSTKGWRFTIARYRLRHESDATPMPLNFESLGRNNDAQVGNQLDKLPEMPWPARSKRDHSDGSAEVPGGFGSGVPHEAFDSVVDISRIPMVAHTFNTLSTEYTTATEALWDAIARVDVTLARTELTVAAAHIDFVNANPVSIVAPNYGPVLGIGNTPNQPWTWRLLRYLTTNGHASDRIDNDGDGIIDNNNGMEGPNTLFRMAGRINVNTAPATVLRSVPSMSLLPDSIQFTQLMRLSGDNATANAAASNPHSFYVSSGNFQRFWDYASAIVAVREGRDVSVRQADGTGNLQIVAAAHPQSPNPRAFASMAEVLAALTVNPPTDNSGGGNHNMFRADRYVDNSTSAGAVQPLPGHRVLSTDVVYGANPTPDYRAFSPDFRERKADGTQMETIEFTPVNPAGDADAVNPSSGGIRARDIYLARWANVLTTRSDVFTAYIALLDEDGRYVRRAQVTFDRSNCFSEARTGGGLPGKPVLPDILLMEEGSYADDMR